MIRQPELDSIMRSWFIEDAAGPEPQRVLASAMALTGARTPRREWVVRLRRGGIATPAHPAAARRQAAALVVVIATLLAILTLAIAAVGGRSPDHPAVGLLATTTATPLGTAPVASHRQVLSAGTDAPVASPTRPAPPEGTSSPIAVDPGLFEPAGRDALAAGSGRTGVAQLADGRVVIGGNGGASPQPVEVYDPATGQFTVNGHMAIQRYGATAIALADGRVLFEGGTGDVQQGSKQYWTVLASAELYDPATGTSTPTGSMTTARTRGSATRLLDGRILIAGGDTTDGDLPWDPGMNSAEIFDPTTGVFTPTAPMNRPRVDPGTALLPDGRVLVVGGVPHSAGVPTAEVFDPSTGTWTMTGSMHPIGESYFNEPRTIVRLLDGRTVVVFGAAGSTLQVPFDLDHRLLKPAVSTVLEVYDPVQNVFTPLGTTATGRIGPSVTVLADGRLLIAGGLTTPFRGTLGTECCIWELDPSATAEIFDPSTNSSVPTGSMGHWRAGQSAILQPDGDVILFGGTDGNSTERFHP